MAEITFTYSVKIKLLSKTKKTYSRVLFSSFSMFMVAEGIASFRMEGRLSIPSPPFPHSLLNSRIPVTICVSSRNCRSWEYFRFKSSNIYFVQNCVLS